MATLTEARESLADVLNSVEGLAVRSRPGVKAPRQGDGWVTVARLTPSGYTRLLATLAAVVVLGADEALAEDLLEVWAGSALDAVTTADFPAGEAVLEPVALVVEGGTVLHAFTITITTELEAPR
jgi:hypothetical protein